MEENTYIRPVTVQLLGSIAVLGCRLSPLKFVGNGPDPIYCAMTPFTVLPHLLETGQSTYYQHYCHLLLT